MLRHVYIHFLQFPELNAMIMRRFKEPGDVEFTRQAVYDVSFHCQLYAIALALLL